MKWPALTSTFLKSLLLKRHDPIGPACPHAGLSLISVEIQMAYGFLNIAMTPSVRAEQARMGSEHIWERFEGAREFDRFDDRVKHFIETRDSFYMATVSETGWPYIQHRGGAPGFLRVVDEKTLAFADYRGNRQYISSGNLAANARACLIVVDYPRRMRLKLYVRAEMLALDDALELGAQVQVPGDKARPERICRMRLETFDWNCRRHITPRFTEAQIDQATAALQQRLAQLESENAEMRRRLGLVDGENQ